MVKHFAIRIEHGNKKGIQISDGLFGEGSRITTSANRCVLFNVLKNKLYIDFKNLTCADFCCGSGIIGFELLSLGCKECLFVDCDKKKLKCVQQSIEKTKFKGETIYAYLPSIFINKTFDIIFFDPPYKNNFCQETIDMIYNNKMLTNDGILIIETLINIIIDDNKYEILDIKKLKNGAKFYFLKYKTNQFD